MKKLLLIFTFVSLLSLAAVGQIPPASPQTEQNQMQENWQSFSPAGEEFSVEAPGVFMPGFINTATTKTTQSRSYKTVVNGIYYYIFSDSVKYPDQNKFVFQFAGSAADSNHQSVVFKFADNFGFYHRILTVSTPTRIYTFQTVSESESGPQLDRFFAGIKINSSLPPIDEPPAPTNMGTGMPPATTNGSVFGSRLPVGGMGSGMGKATRSDINQPATNPPVAIPTDPIQTVAREIHSKPRASYTDLARFYDISGAVRTRVTFLANGTMGAVTPLNKLPFGLTEEAVKAAKSITFKPARKNGIPYSTTAIVQYVFTIY